MKKWGDAITASVSRGQRQIIEHLFKLAWSRNPEPKARWRRTVVTQRIELSRALTPSLRRMVAEKLERLHRDALDIVREDFADREPGAPLDFSLRWVLPQILGEEDDPLA